ncbi:AAA family ATPase [Natranaerofaba carboxydovora]|uniref:SF1B family DNA helicase RecD2 n=1 Tax=Natranaerofaba carboxydovora TaxID=2742683 RepID=UPI001F129BE9|nr:AAA family ATPase [Natranaerofaba carboxydovora]UMZ75028.1 ATP-dependent RecD-like DNA helicase [Natranaerofaba carboxydovora]
MTTSLEGILKNITFHNSDNLFTVAKLLTRPDNEVITVVGQLPELTPGERLVVNGKFESHKKFGRQFHVESYEIKLPVTTEGLVRFLGSGMIKGIGPKTAESLVSHFGKNILQIIENDPERLTEVDGIGAEKAKKISKGFLEHKKVKDIMVFLQGFGVSPAYALKIYKRFGDKTMELVSENPYCLAREVFGIGFKIADKIARNMGIGENSKERKKAAILYILEEASNKGDTYLTKKELEEALIEFEVTTEDMPAIIDELSKAKEIILEDNKEEGQIIYLPPYYHAEIGIAKRLTELETMGGGVLKEHLNNWNKMVENLAGSISTPDDASKEKLGNEEANEANKEVNNEATKGANTVELSTEQLEVLNKLPHSGAMVITGGPGTGKTTVIKSIIYLAEKFGLNIYLGAPTGRAAKRMSEATGKEAKTIHRLLEFSYESGEGMKFNKNTENPLECDLLIIDEASMLDLLLMNRLVKAVPPGCKLVLVGDIDQLPSVGAGNVLRDIIDSHKIPVVRLKTIFRQAKESMVVVNAHRINQGKFPMLNVKDKDFFFINREEPEEVVNTIISLCKHRLPKYENLHPRDDIQVLAPMRRTDTGVDNLNTSLQGALNPPSGQKPEISFGTFSYRLGDKLMQLKNDYQKEVFNGDMGIIHHVDAEEGSIKVRFEENTEDRIIEYERNELDSLIPAYAVSVHKSQGSEYPVVVMPVTTQHFIMLQRNLIYTAITRAKKLVVLVGTKKAIGMAISNNKVESRNSLLDYRLKQFK